MNFDPVRYERLCKRVSERSPSGDVDAVHDAFLETQQAGFAHFEARAFLRMKDEFRRRQRQAERFRAWREVALSNDRGAACQTSEAEEHDQSVRQLQRAIAQLPAKYDKIVRMKYLDGLTAQEISDTLELPVKTVYTRLRRALRKLRLLLEASREGGIA